MLSFQRAILTRCRALTRRGSAIAEIEIRVAILERQLRDIGRREQTTALPDHVRVIQSLCGRSRGHYRVAGDRRLASLAHGARSDH